MLTPNLDCWISRQFPDSHDLYGQPVLGSRVRERCAVVRLRDEAKHSTVRADSSASRGHAEEFVTSNKILLLAGTIARLDDKLEVLGIQMRVTSVFPRHDVSGRLDHYEVQGELWE